MLKWVPVRPTWPRLTFTATSHIYKQKRKLKVFVSTLKIYNFVRVLYGHTV